MFDHITNEDITRAFNNLKAYTDRRTVALTLIVAISIIVGIIFHSQLREELDTKASIADTTEIKLSLQAPQSSGQSIQIPEDIPAKVEVSNPVEEKQTENTVITAPVEINYGGKYNNLWEYLEYGDIVEYFQPESTEVLFRYVHNDILFSTIMDLDPPQFRSLQNTVTEPYTSHTKGFKVNATVEGINSSINWIEDANGQPVWDPSMRKAPRELNELELWSLKYLETKGYNFLLRDLFDTLPKCKDDFDWGGSTCRYIQWSPAEGHARAAAFYSYANNPDNNVWVQIWGAVDARYRWIDAESEEPLERFDETADLWILPESGWLGLQIGITGEGSYNDPETWETTYTIKIEPGFVVGIDQAGYIYNSGPLGWVMPEEYMAKRTVEWPKEKILALLAEIEIETTE
jgi:hypothetical protein